MKRLFLLTLSLFSMSAVLAADYRLFTDQDGRTIEAKIIKLDASMKKVTLERRNKKKATVPVNVFSEEDQKYILAWKPDTSLREAPQTENPKPLKKSELKQIAKRYEEEMNNKEWRISDSRSIYVLQVLNDAKYYYDVGTKTISVIDIEDSAFELELEINATPKRNVVEQGKHDRVYRGWAILCSNGDVKYNSFINPHPVEIATHVISKTGWKYKFKEPIDIGAFVGTLESCGIPTFNLTSNSTREDLIDEVPKIADWVMENGHKHDTTQPIAYYPEDLIEDKLKKVDQYF
ncbi:hypothetical protein EGM51_15200 [Verrucomicrobia bacterium S94]|nr:hypothetical protein EGM51_15200 [Verrucomicrobia bacterium S94]